MKNILIILIGALFFITYSVISLEEVFSFQKNLEMKQFLGLGSLFIGLGTFSGAIFYIIDGIWGLGTWKCEADLMYLRLRIPAQLFYFLSKTLLYIGFAVSVCFPINMFIDQMRAIDNLSHFFQQNADFYFSFAIFSVIVFGIMITAIYLGIYFLVLISRFFYVQTPTFGINIPYFTDLRGQTHSISMIEKWIIKPFEVWIEINDKPDGYGLFLQVTGGEIEIANSLFINRLKKYAQELNRVIGQRSIEINK